jgi:hypothetical protein
MSITNRRELEATRDKLAWLEKEHDSIKRQPTDSPHSHELTLRSLKVMINQMKEEIACFDVHGGGESVVTRYEKMDRSQIDIVMSIELKLD